MRSRSRGSDPPYPSTYLSSKQRNTRAVRLARYRRGTGVACRDFESYRRRCTVYAANKKCRHQLSVCRQQRRMIVPFVAAIGIPLVDFRTYAVAFASGINHVHPLCFSAITGPQHIHVVPFVPGMEENLPSRYATPGWLLRYCHESGGSKGGKACPLMLVPVLVCCRHRESLCRVPLPGTHRT